MLERSQEIAVMTERLKSRLNFFTGTLSKKVVYKNKAGEVIHYDPNRKGVLTMTISDDFHGRVDELFESGEVKGYRKLAVEMVKINTDQKQACQINVGYTPGMTFFKGDRNMEMDLVTNKVYRLVDGERQELDKASEDILCMGLNVLEAKKVRITGSCFVDESNQSFDANFPNQICLEV